MPKNKNKKGKQHVKASKWLYRFEVNKTSTEKVTTTSKDSDGNDVSVTKEEEVTKPMECYILRPKRSLIDQAELYYGVELAKGVKAGLLTKSLIHKRYSDDGGLFSEKDQELYSNLQLRLLRNEKELQTLEIADAENEEEKEKKNKKAAQLLFDMTEIRNQMQDFESMREAIFDQTADTRAKNKIVLWWVLNLSYIKDELENEEIVPLFKGNSQEEKENCYDTYEELNLDHINNAMKHFAYFISFWHNGQAVTKEDFERVKMFLDIDLEGGTEAEAEKKAVNEEPPEEPTPEEPTPEEPTPEESTPEEPTPEESPSEKVEEAAPQLEEEGDEVKVNTEEPEPDEDK